MSECPRVLSIQSHVVSGYVGNKCATFPLQVLGFEVDAINSVHFSNHTGYGYLKGQILTDKDLADLINGLSHNKLDTYSHLLTGYVGSVSFLTQIADVVNHLRKVNPNLTYVCDPVMGDNGHMYVPKELLPIYRTKIIPLADIITPNQFEAELLTGQSIKTVTDAWNAVEALHSYGVKTVVLSSTELGNSEYLLGLGSTLIGNKKLSMTIKIPKIPGSFTGTGDLFAAVFLAWMHKSKDDLKTALENTIATIQSVLKLTVESSTNDATNSIVELKIIQSKNIIENPNVTIFADMK